MAIAPIDLQTLFTQIDKVGRAQTAQREGHAIQQAQDGVQHQKKIDEQIQQVNEAQDTGEGADKVDDRAPRQKNEEKIKNKKENENEESEDEEKTPPIIIRDPSLGNKIDLTY